MTPLEELIMKKTFNYFENHGNEDGTDNFTIIYGDQEGDLGEGIIVGAEDTEDSAIEACKRLNEILSKESTHTEQIAIGFSIWTEKNGWDWSGNHQVFINDNFEPKEGSKLFKDYMESLKP